MPFVTERRKEALPADLASVPLGPARFFAAIFDLSRARQALLSVSQPALGAVLAIGGLPSPRVVMLGLIAATAGYLAVFSLNDVLDRRVDVRALAAGKAEFSGFDLDTAFMRHPLARGDISMNFAIAWVAVLGATAAWCAYVLAPVCLALFAVAVALEVAYCKLRSVTWSKTFVSGAMVGVGGLAGWAAVAPVDARALSFFAFLALWEIAGRNIPNDLSDLLADSRTGIRTLATVFDEKTSALATAGGAVATMIAIALLPAPGASVAVCLALGIWAMGIPAARLVRRPESSQAAQYFNRASLLPALLLPVVIVAFMAAAR
jgi:4-hydroxybenzoate polyprenyltransferase